MLRPSSATQPSNLGCRPFVILLERDEQRVRHVHAHIIPKLPECEIWPATDSQSKEVDTFLGNGQRPIARRYRNSLTRGKLACTMSHLRLWEKITEDGIDRALILEDDAQLEPGFLETTRELLEEAPIDFHMIYLFVHPKHYRPEAPLLEGARHLTAHYFTWGRVAYVLTGEGAEILLKHFRTLSDHGDIMINRAIEDGDLNAYICRPRMVRSVGQISSSAEEEYLPSNIWGTPRIRGFRLRRLLFGLGTLGRRLRRS